MIDSLENSVSVSSCERTYKNNKTSSDRVTKTALYHQESLAGSTSMMPSRAENKFSFLGNAVCKVKNSNGAPLQIKIPSYNPAKTNSQNYNSKPSIAADKY